MQTADTNTMTHLLLIDYQNDFIRGSLAVEKASSIRQAIAMCIAMSDATYASRDRHPANHCSFSDNGGIWPRHCEDGTWGFELDEVVDENDVFIVDKGTDPSFETFSAFKNTDLLPLLRFNGVEKLIVAGVATDYCVKDSVLDALAAGIEVMVITNAIAGVAEDSTKLALIEMSKAGAQFAHIKTVKDTGTFKLVPVRLKNTVAV